MKRLNGGEYLIDLSNGTIDDGALLGVNDEFLSLFPIVNGNLKKNRIYVKMSGIIVPCVYTISGLILTISGVFNNGENGLVLLTISCEYDVGEFDVVSIDSISIESIEKEDVLSTNDIENGEIENAKPIYCHPISIRNDTSKLLITCLIFNNDNTPFTLETFKDFLDTLYEQVGSNIRIMLSGAYNHSTYTCIASYLYKSETGYGILGYSIDGSLIDFPGTFDAIIPATSILSDAVNKIN